MVLFNEQGDIIINALTKEDLVNNHELIVDICKIEDMTRQQNVLAQIKAYAVQLGVGQEFEGLWSAYNDLWNEKKEAPSNFASLSDQYGVAQTWDGMRSGTTWYGQRKTTQMQPFTLPQIQSLRDLRAKPLALADELIEGVLRKGHKMLLSGPSKAGKSFAQVQLCVAIAEGGKWFGWQCAQGKVLYVNLEIDEKSARDRFDKVYEAMGIQKQHDNNIDMLNLRGKAVPMDVLAPQLIEATKGKGFSAIILDPIYKVITGDENSAEKMAQFCNCLDTICREVGCSVIYCHHHSKGAQSYKKSMDRASGSGVFARDADAILDMIQLSDKQLEGKKPNALATAWRVTGTLREFAPFKPRNLWFVYPVHLVDETGELDGIAEEGSVEDARSKGRELGNQVQTENAMSRKNIARKMIETGVQKFGGVNIYDLASKLGTSDRTVRTYVGDMRDYVIKKCMIVAA